MAERSVIGCCFAIVTNKKSYEQLELVPGCSYGRISPNCAIRRQRGNYATNCYSRRHVSYSEATARRREAKRRQRAAAGQRLRLQQASGANTDPTVSARIASLAPKVTSRTVRHISRELRLDAIGRDGSPSAAAISRRIWEWTKRQRSRTSARTS
jgi:hypothetical protein